MVTMTFVFFSFLGLVQKPPSKCKCCCFYSKLSLCKRYQCKYCNLVWTKLLHCVTLCSRHWIAWL